MLTTLIIGLGRSGLGLHIPVLARLRAAGGTGFHPVPPHPVVAVDPCGPDPYGHPHDVTVVDSLHKARGLLVPDRTVVHLCTPPAVRPELLREVAALGFSRIIVEKPLARTPEDLEAVLGLARRHRLRLSVVAPWLHSALTGRLVALLDGGTLGRLRAVTITQHKPRFRRSLASHSHDSAFDVEIPHALGLALRLAGDAEVTGAATTGLRFGGEHRPAMGSANLTLRHHTGVRTTITSDLTSPVRVRRAVLELTGGRVVADYPVSQDDDIAQLRVTRRDEPGDGGPPSPELLRDDALGAFLAHAYRRYAAGGEGDLEQHVRACVLLHDAKRHAAAATTRTGAAPVPATGGEAAPGIVYAGIGDEAGGTPDDQLAALQALGWSAIELRTVGGTAIADLTDADFARLAGRLDGAGLRAVCLDSRIGDWSRPITAPFERDLAELRVLARRCRELGTRFIRIMSYPNDGLDEAEWRRQVLYRLRVLTGHAEAHGLVLLHENCSGWAGSRADRALELLAAVGSPALGLLFDVGNGVPHGYDSREMLDALVPHVRHVHIKDAVGGSMHTRYTLPGHGGARVADCLRALLDGGYTGALSIEPHTALRPHEGHDTTAGGGVAAFVAYGRELERLVREQVLPGSPAVRAAP